MGPPESTSAASAKGSGGAYVEQDAIASPVRFGSHGGGCVCDGFANGVWVRHIANLVGQLGNVTHQIDDLADHVVKLTGPIGNLVRHIASLVRPIGNWTGQIAKLMGRDGNDGYA